MTLHPQEQEGDPLVTLAEITEIELTILRRMHGLTNGNHRSQFRGSGLDFVGLRQWQPGDRSSAIDWAQSTFTNFSPVVIREYEQPCTATVIAVADVSLSTRCDMGDGSIRQTIARAIATIGMSSVFFQDAFGLMTFDTASRRFRVVRPRIGRNQVTHCLDAYQHGRGLEEVKQAGSIAMTFSGFIRRTSLVPVISDFLFDDVETVLQELSYLNATHDAFLVLVDSAFAFDVPVPSAGWFEAFDVETGRARLLSRTALRHLGRRAREWQDEVERMAKNVKLDVLRLGLHQAENDIAIVEFAGERLLRKR